MREPYPGDFGSRYEYERAMKECTDYRARLHENSLSYVLELKLQLNKTNTAIKRELDLDSLR